MDLPKFEEKELNVVGEIPAYFPGAPGTPLYDFPLPRSEGILQLYRRQPVWEVTTVESGFFTPRIYPDNVARSFVFDAEGFDL